MSVTRILIGITSCRKHKERRDACRATWISRPVAGIKPVFFVGSGAPLPDEPDTVALDCPDTYEELPAKIRAFFKYALQHEPFDWFFKCDDDTYVVQNRLHDLTIGGHEFAGNAEFLDNKGYASGGAGYLLSRRMVAILANDRSLPVTGCEDIIMTKAALRHGATALPSPRLIWTAAPAPRSDNDLITCHWCDPRKMAVVHAGLTDEVLGRFHVTHRHWQDQLYLYKMGIFRRASTGCAGNWTMDESGALHLHWFDWAEEIVHPNKQNYQSEIMRLVAIEDSRDALSIRKGNQEEAQTTDPTLATKIQIRCFNLHRRPDRKFCISQTAPEPLLARMQFVSAVDGKRVNRRRLSKWKISPSAYAINLSKRLALRAFLQSDCGALLLLEDDVCFERSFWSGLVELIEKAPTDWGMLFLGGTHLELARPTTTPGIVRCARVHYNHAWIIRRSCARNLIRALARKPFSHPCSDQTIGALQDVIPTYAPTRWLAFQRRGMSDNGFGLLHRPMRPISQRLRPWMHDDEIAVLQCAIKPGMRVLEWGAGGSTLLAAQLVGKHGHVDSIEHEHAYAHQVSTTLEAEGCDPQASVHLVQPNYGDSKITVARPKQFQRYVAKALELGEKMPYDICLIDGRDRVACALAAVQVLKSGAFLFFHDFAAPDRLRYREWLPEILQHYELCFEITHTPQTMAVFKKLM